MATGERITAEARGALVHLPRQPEAEPLHDPRQGDVDEWGRSEHIRQLARRLYDPLYRSRFRVEYTRLDGQLQVGGRRNFEPARERSRKLQVQGEAVGNLRRRWTTPAQR